MNRRLFFSIIALFSGMLNDLPTVHLIPDCSISKVENFPEFMVAIYQIQATITTLSIALISLMSGVSNETIYGVSISHYIMQMKPKVLKHKNIIIFLLSLILINYFFISFKFYNLVISVFILTIVLIIFMSVEIFEVFKGREPLKKEIGNHIKGKYTEIKLLDTLFNDTLTAIDRDETLRFKENMDLLIIIFEKSIKNFINDKALVAKWENNLIEIFSKGLGKTRGKILKMSYEYFDQIYSILFKERDIAAVRINNGEAKHDISLNLI
ncbi:hypothetical protein J2Z35_001099 [Acetoanaerobium pronyense]|uniref:Uncharacterized protein n=1 Tax=Acetoanaerobium pronyense TaxID=1482736 RepID=A0ABS4KHR5_9FIRM|nr:hypothetical protein [Acetoanaerobium pronyense]MBP2027305.1 hypothetical protein [Acetoanaerobium pronyense]